MAKAPVIKFPRIHAGFYSVTQDGELRGYIMKEETDNKETNWYVFDNSTPDLDIAMLNPEDAIDAPDTLFREAKAVATAYFLKTPFEAKAATSEPAEVTVEPELEGEEPEMAMEDETEGDWEENTIDMEFDEEGIEFELVGEDELEEALALA